MSLFSSMRSWFGGALGDILGVQSGKPGYSLNGGARGLGVDGALQISTVWACLDRRAGAVASMPCFVYKQLAGGEKTLARTERLYQLLHDQPNNRMTPFEFWRAMMLNHDLRGNGYARIDRDANGEALALWPMPADQVEQKILDDGTVVYAYRLGSNVAILAAQNVLHLKNLGNGTIGLSKLEFMSSTLDEQAKAQSDASKIFGSGGKPAGVLTVDKVLNDKQRENARRTFNEMSLTSDNKLHLLEADMKFQQLTMTPAEQQLLETRHYGVEEICRWFDVPPVLVHHANVTSWGSGIAEIREGWCIFSIGPLVVNLQQAVQRCVLTPRQRATLKVEFSLDALLRASPSLRADINAKNVQNGLKTRAEVRQLEGDPFIPGTDVLTAQSNLVPLHMLGRLKPAAGGDGSNIAQ
ncbi:HK97 family phage portal protein [Pseudoduganella lurida]|uniref:HK97 family phage portal protein n=1 Tax=Pseudoduganella lurida TaxID=1036180 RepID=A0A562R7Y1_9BURK|nr:phage portal protein [Pseudoduganella lurida]TWI65179.1 HK97 family phage portal protein [Pseudoduganella lurida]